MIIAKTRDELLGVLQCTRPETSRGFVPTMGALHAGHLSLISRSQAENDTTIVSIFLNPTQFNNPLDLETYPVSFEEDCTLLRKQGVDILFAPTFQEMYPDGYDVSIIEKKLSHTLCGASRPSHFEGVLTIVAKLFMLVSPQKAYFGEKDYQQYLLIKKMSEALFFPIEIVPCPIVRESSGLAMSSRNRRLSVRGREKAAALYQEITSGKTVLKMKQSLEAQDFVVDYLEKIGNRIFVAATLEHVRLIDNVCC